jgi:SAM-dependent methyltransferase
MPRQVRLFLLSFLLLFVELVLIRWTAAFVVYLSYFTNFVLLASFLGIGVGFLRPRPVLFRFAPAVLGLLVTLVYVFPTRLSHSGGNLLYFGARTHTGGAPIWVALPLVFVAAALALTTIASEAAAVFRTLRPLQAYRYDILGSIVGVVAFALVSLARLPPLAWGGLVAAVFLALYGRSVRALQVAGLAALLVALGLGSYAAGLTWSPYYAIKAQRDPLVPSVVHVSVNGVPHQTIEPLSKRAEQGASYYFIPYRRLRSPRLREVLVIGAGNGTDVAVALRHGARRVDAVEIDPRLLALGRELNPNRPYADSRVHAYVEDGRAFLQRTHRRYDLILFALPDSLTLIANQSSLRLESYLFTLEAMRSAREHLTDRGVFAMYNFYRKQWLVDRFARTLDDAFGHAPCVDEHWGSGAVLGPVADLTVGRAAASVACPHALWQPRGGPAPATDDHPFPYLRSRSLPGFYLAALAMILAVSLLATRSAAGPFRVMLPYLDLFFMGAAFLLLETKSVVQFALLFGTTWIVNAFVFVGVLLAVLAAIETARLLPRAPRLLLYALLLGALALAWSVLPESLLGLSFWPRLVAAIAVAFVPIFLANLIFAQRFAEVEAPTTAFGANLIGAMVGGLLEYSSLIVGYRALIPLVGILYGLALVAGRRHLRAPVRAEVGAAATS